MHAIMIQFRISSVRSMRRPTSSTLSVARKVATPIQYTTCASSGPASLRAERKKTAPAALAAHAGQPDCMK
jgi:hypothetical protein